VSYEPGGARGVQLRATVSEFGPLLLARALDLNDTQTSGLALLFRFADRAGLPILDIADLRSVLQYAGSDAGKAGWPSTAVCAGDWRILRKLVELNTGRGPAFGEPVLMSTSLPRPATAGCGHRLELSDVQDRPRLFSTAMMWLLAGSIRPPEAGDLDRQIGVLRRSSFLFADAPQAAWSRSSRS
jgi:DNA helicase HerA-like ATPase